MAAGRGPGEKHNFRSFISAGVVGFSARISTLKWFEEREFGVFTLHPRYSLFKLFRLFSLYDYR